MASPLGITFIVIIIIIISSEVKTSIGITGMFYMRPPELYSFFELIKKYINQYFRLKFKKIVVGGDLCKHARSRNRQYPKVVSFQRHQMQHPVHNDLRLQKIFSLVQLHSV